MRWLYTLLCLWPLALFGAAGDITGAWVDTNGWVLKVRISTILTNGTYTWTYRTNTFYWQGTNYQYTATTFSPPSNVKLDFVSQGYDDAGNLTTYNRTIYGTKHLRVPGTESTTDTEADGNDAIAKCALSDFVSLSCSNLTLTVSANWYSNNAACTSIEVTNLSQAIDPKCVAQWAMVDRQNITSNNMTVAVIAFHQSGNLGRPVRAVKFVSTGNTSGVKVTNIVTTPSIDYRRGNASPVWTYNVDQDISGMTQGEYIQTAATVYPCYGGTNAVVDSQNEATGIGPTLPTLTNLCNRLGTYGSAWAVVDSSGGTAGVVSSNAIVSWPTACFTNIGAALNAICKSNAIWYGATRSNSENSVIYLNWDGSPWFGTALASGIAYPVIPCTITRYPTNIRSSCVLTQQQSYTDNYHKRFRLYDITIDFQSAIALGSALDFLHVDHCTIATAGTANQFGGSSKTNVYVTQCVVSNTSKGFVGAAAIDVRYKLVEGNSFYNTNACPLQAYTVIGNKRMIRQEVAAASEISTDWTTPQPRPDCGIFAYNDFRGLHSASEAFYGGTTCTNGYALVGNVFENYYAISSALVNIAGSEGDESAVTNLIIWGNNFLGNRALVAYNAVAVTAKWRVLWSVKNNLWDAFNIKSDFYAGSGDPARIGDWSCMWGVGWTGNLSPMTSHATAGNAYFPCDFMGWNSFHALLNHTNFFRFVNLQSYNNTAVVGMGDYHVRSDSPLVYLNNLDYPTKGDIEGNACGNFGPPGAYSSASPRKGGGFF